MNLIGADKEFLNFTLQRKISAQPRAEEESHFNHEAVYNETVVLSERLKIEDILNFLRRLSREIKFHQVEGGFLDRIHQQAFIGLFKLLKNLQRKAWSKY